MEHISPLLQALVDNLGESAAVIILAVLALSASKVKTWWKDRISRRFERGINQNVRLRELLSELRVPYSADRVCLYQAFNGEHYLAGGSVMKMFLTHFVTKVGVANPPIGQMIPTTQMVMSLKALQSEPFSVFEADTFVDDNFLEELFTETGNSKVMVTAVRDVRKNWVGILCVSWMSDSGKLDEKPLLKYSRMIGEFLSIHS
jgi:hypothetical protein